MPGKVTDPSLLAQLDAPDLARPKVTDLETLRALEGPGAGEAAGRAVKQGFSFGFGDELEGLRKAGGRSGLGTRLLLQAVPFVGPMIGGGDVEEVARLAREHPEVKSLPLLEQIKLSLGGARAYENQPSLAKLVTGAKDRTFGEDYRAARDADREANKEASKKYPKLSVAGEIAGGLANPLNYVAAPVRAAGLLPRVAQGMRIGAGMGAAAGAGASEADSAGGVVADTAMGGAGGAALGGALPVVGEGVRRTAGRLASRAGEKAVEWGRKALSGVGSPLSARKPIAEEAVKQAIKEGQIRDFSTVQGIFDRLSEAAERKGIAYGDILAELEKAGVEGPNAVVLAKQIAQRAAQAKATSLGSARPIMLLRASKELPTKVSPTPFASKRLGLMQAEEIKRGLQKEAKLEYDKIARRKTVAGETKEELASIMREAIEEAVDQQSAKAPDAAAAFGPVKKGLSNTLGALRVAEEGAARAARRKPFSLTSTIVGTGIGGATGSPVLGFLGALGHGVLDSRLSSTGAVNAARAEKALNALARGLSSPQREALERALTARAGENGLRWPFALSPAAADEEPKP